MNGPISKLSDPLLFIIWVAGLLFGLVLHNVVQARLAARLGDSSAKNSGLASTEPQNHFTLFSLIFYLLVGFCTPQTIPLRGSYLRGRRNDEVKVWLSGPLALVVWAFVLLVLEKVIGLLGTSSVIISTSSGLFLAAFSSLLHAVVFIFPLPGFDGGYALYAVGNYQTRQTLDRIAAAGPLVIFIFFLV